MTQLILMILLSIAPAEPHDPDQTGRVIDLLADYQLNHDEVFKKGYAFVGKGVEVFETANNSHVTDRWYLCVYEGAHRRLDASGRAGSSKSNMYLESWMQYLEYDNKRLFRPSMRHDATIDTSTKQWKKEQEEKNTRMHLTVPQPMRSLLKSSIGYRGWTDPHAPCGSEFLLSDAAELIEGKYTKDGDIEATFRIESNFPVTVMIKFGKKQNFLPIETLMKVQLRGAWRAASLTEVTWERRGSYSVPEVVRFTEFPLSTRSAKLQLEVKFDWRVGSQVTRSIAPELNDWREPFREMFESDWQ